MSYRRSYEVQVVHVGLDSISSATSSVVPQLPNTRIDPLLLAHRSDLSRDAACSVLPMLKLHASTAHMSFSSKVQQLHHADWMDKPKRLHGPGSRGQCDDPRHVFAREKDLSNKLHCTSIMTDSTSFEMPWATEQRR